MVVVVLVFDTPGSRSNSWWIFHTSLSFFSHSSPSRSTNIDFFEKEYNNASFSSLLLLLLVVVFIAYRSGHSNALHCIRFGVPLFPTKSSSKSSSLLIVSVSKSFTGFFTSPCINSAPNSTGHFAILRVCLHLPPTVECASKSATFSAFFSSSSRNAKQISLAQDKPDIPAPRIATSNIMSSKFSSSFVFVSLSLSFSESFFSLPFCPMMILWCFSISNCIIYNYDSSKKEE